MESKFICIQGLLYLGKEILIRGNVYILIYDDSDDTYHITINSQQFFANKDDMNIYFRPIFKFGR